MGKSKKILTGILAVLLMFTVIFILANSIGFKRDSPKTSRIIYLDEMMASIDGEPFHKLSLPAKVDNLKPGTPVILKATITPDSYDGVYIKSLYTDADVYFDDKLVFTFGKKENYPKFMTNPSSEIHIIETYGKNEPMDLRIEYSSPCNTKSIFLDVPMVGTSKELIMERSSKYGISWILSIITLAIGVALLIVYLFIQFISKRAILFAWLGLFSISAGMWFFSSNEFTITVLPDTTWQYVTAYLGFSLFIIPLIMFTRNAINFEKSGFSWFLGIFYIISSIAAIVLQITKLVPLHISWYFFYYTLPVALLILAILVFKEFIINKNKFAGTFTVLTLVLLASLVIENIHNPLYITLSSVDFFQLGVVIYLLSMGIIAAMTIKESYRLQKMKESLERDKEMIAIQTEEQRDEGLTLAKNEQILSRQRHDLRHHLIALQELSGDNEDIKKYISNLISSIPKAKERYCENNIVNAVISHYAHIYERNNIEFKYNLTVPADLEQNVESDLCAIFSNLLENAEEACMRMDNGRKYVHINSSMQYSILTITMDNTFNGDVKKKDNRFFSSKRDSYGIGIASIQAIAESRHGDSRFTSDENVFSSSVYLKI